MEVSDSGGAGAPDAEPFPLHAVVLEEDEQTARTMLENQREVELRERRRIAKGKYMAGEPPPIPKVHSQVNSLNAAGFAPLHCAAAKGNRAIASLLLDYGADINLRNREGETPLHVAAFYGHETVARLLLDFQSDPCARDHDGWTALHNAVSQGHLSTARLLLGRLSRLHQDRNQRAKAGQTPLMLACSKGNTEMARLLIENGGDIELRDSFGATAYDYAALREHVLLCFLLSASNTKLGRVSATAVLEAVVETERATLFAQYGKGDFPQFTSLSGTPTTLDNSLPSSEWFWVSAWRVVCEPETSTDGWRYSKEEDARWQDMQPQPSRFAWTRKRLWVRLRKLRADSALAAAFQRDTAQARTMEATDPPGALALYRAAIETYMSAIKTEPDAKRREQALGEVSAAMERAEAMARLVKEASQRAQRAEVLQPDMSGDLLSTPDEASSSSERVATEPLAIAAATKEASRDHALTPPPSLTSNGEVQWEMDADAPTCRGCERAFGLLLRRHHCRRCGRVFCDACSSRTAVVRGLDARVCEACFADEQRSAPADVFDDVALGDFSAGGVPAAAAAHDSRPSSPDSPRADASAFTECPVCSLRLRSMSEEERDAHVEACLSNAERTPKGRRYLAHVLTNASPAADRVVECPICFEEFQPMDEVATMDCLCMYHKACIDGWLLRGTGCPVHSQ